MPTGKYYYAHTTTGCESEWEPLRAHLEAVAGRTARFASYFDAESLGFLAGLWHDLGKYQPDFQRRLRGERVQVEHSGLGAALASGKEPPIEYQAVAFAIAGHHAGLANLRSNESASSSGRVIEGRKTLMERLRENAPRLGEVRAIVPSEIYDAGAALSISRPFAGDGDSGTQARRFELLTRFLFSALVDADRTATNEFYARLEGHKSHQDLRYDSLCVLLDRLRKVQSGFEGRSHVDSLRRDILGACLEGAAEGPGCFSLAAPTGGGKTLSAMRFALEHALRNGLRRVIVVIPYTSIIEQNAKVYREILGDRNVLEHHSNIDEQTRGERDGQREILRKLAAENWDSPVVVTTTVQFFDSLFSDHPSRCRKLHNIAKSVVILDEVQTLPPGMMRPILDVLGELCGPRLGCSVVLSTATPPALTHRDDFPYGLRDVRPILPDARALAGRARRVRVRWEIDEPIEYGELASRLSEHERVLAIVHKRADARELAESMLAVSGGDGLFHLSALMCPAHRLDRIEAIKRRLDDGQPCRVVSTQLVEAGVDLDFPVVYRSLAGLDSLTQAAGRCDREGRLTEANRASGHAEPGGELVVFRAPTSPPPGVLQKAQETTAELLAKHEGDLDIFDPAICESFFELLYSKEDLDAARVQHHRANLDFLTTAACFQMIDSTMHPIAVPWGEGAERIRRFRESDQPTRALQRALQPYLVQVGPYHRDALHAAGVIERVHDRLDVLLEHHAKSYDPVFGLDVKASGAMDAAWQVV